MLQNIMDSKQKPEMTQVRVNDEMHQLMTSVV